jgi:hypothetical protein
VLSAVGLWGCGGYVREQTIVELQTRTAEARMQMYQPYLLPILPLDSEQVRYAGFGASQRRDGSFSSTTVLDDSLGTHWSIPQNSTDYGAQFVFHPRGILAGVEVATDHVLFFGGGDFQLNSVAFNFWGGSGGTVYRTRLVHHDQFKDILTDSTWWADDTASGGGGLFLASGAAFLYRRGPVSPFVASRVTLMTSAELFGDGPSLNLSQGVVEAGVRLDPISRIHGILGCGARTFLSSEIHGVDWRVFGGLGIDIRTRWDNPYPGYDGR